MISMIAVQLAAQNAPRPQVESGSKNQIEDSGTVSVNLYSNEFLRLSYRFPVKLSGYSPSEWRRIREEQEREAFRNRPAEAAEHARSDSRIYFLFRAVDEAPGSSPVRTAVFVLGGDVSKIPRPRDQKVAPADITFDALRSAVFSLPSLPNFQELRISPLNEEIYYGGRRFSRARFKAKYKSASGTVSVWGCTLGTVWRDYALLWFFYAPSEKELRALVESANSIRFEKN